ncbi:MAG: alanine--tRNA ligase [Opitutales bacterium]
MTSAEIRQSFLDFFASKQHRVVPSASLMPDAPNLLFTNAGMNQFVPYFLGERTPAFTRAADTQKCIRAGGKHNDLEDVGFDAYHQTFFEMLGNWSFGDYFKQEAISWAWELITEVWKFPKERLYATVYKPGPGDPSEFDQEAYDYWKAIFEKAGLDPDVHIVNGNKKDNFWMMGDTGPCGPCSELHIDLTPEGDTKGSLVNEDSPWCIEIWNLVFIQFNAGEDGSFSPLPSKHVDTGMGFERVAGIIATTQGFTNFSAPPSNYESDLFQDIFKSISALCSESYTSTLPEVGEEPTTEEKKDCAFRVIADHIRTLSFSIADGILPGNEGRNYVLRRILRRAVMFGKKLDLPAGFFAKLADPLVDKMGPFFPELEKQREVIKKVITAEENAFDKTIDRGLQLLNGIFSKTEDASKTISGEETFTLYDTYGFPVDLTELIARERGWTVDSEGFEVAMEAQRQRARAAQKKTTITVRSEDDDAAATEFVGFEGSLSEIETTLVEVVSVEEDKHAIIVEKTPFYAEMGGQVGDTGTAIIDDKPLKIVDTQKDAHGRFLHFLEESVEASAGCAVTLTVDNERRTPIERHHSATHILNWALREVLGTHVRQAGSLVTPERLRFDFAHFEALTSDQIETIENLVNARTLENGPVQTSEIAIEDKPEDVVAVFGEKYGDRVRVVDIGGFSKELCGGTHVSSAGEIGTIKIVGESAIAAGVRRIEAVAGAPAKSWIDNQLTHLSGASAALNCRPDQLITRIESLLSDKKAAEQKLKAAEQKDAAALADTLAAGAAEMGGIQLVKKAVSIENPKELRTLGAQVLGKLDSGLVVLATASKNKVSIAALSSKEAIAAGYKAGDIIRKLAPAFDGKGGGKPDFAMGGGVDNGKVAETLQDFEITA